MSVLRPRTQERQVAAVSTEASAGQSRRAARPARRRVITWQHAEKPRVSDCRLAGIMTYSESTKLA